MQTQPQAPSEVRAVLVLGVDHTLVSGTPHSRHRNIIRGIDLQVFTWATRL